jgi:hypothetical protein
VEGPNVRPVDPSEASRGRVDSVTVRDWGSGEPADLGSLKVESVKQDYALNDTRPFYEALARKLEWQQVRGAHNAHSAASIASSTATFHRNPCVKLLSALSRRNCVTKRIYAG